jgi:hypothetical protein
MAKAGYARGVTCPTSRIFRLSLRQGITSSLRTVHVYFLSKTERGPGWLIAYRPRSPESCRIKNPN